MLLPFEPGRVTIAQSKIAMEKLMLILYTFKDN